MDYGALLADSWKTIWKHKALLAFGSLAGLPLVVGLLLDALMPERWTNLLSGSSTGDSELSILGLWPEFIIATLAQSFAVAGILFSTRKALRTEASTPTGPIQARSGGLLWLWVRILSLWIMVGVVVTATLGLAVGCQLLFALVTLGFSLLVWLLPFLVGVVLWIATAHFVMDLTTAALALEGIEIRPALRRTWHIFSTRTKPAVIVAAMLTVLIVTAPILLAVPDFLAGFVPLLLAEAEPASTAQMVTLGLVLRLGYLPFHVLGLAIAVAFVYCGWGLAYLRLSRPPGAFAVS